MTPDKSFKVKTQGFEGPLDLLLDLIEKRKFLINDVSLARVTDDFIEHAKRLDYVSMGESAHFILVASTLLLVKSRSLLPELNLTDEERGDIRNLELRLKIYEHVKETAKNIKKLFGSKMIFFRSQPKTIKQVFAPDPEFTLEKCLTSLKDLIDRLPKKEKLPKNVIKKSISLEDMIVTLTARITSHLRMSFKDFTKEHKDNRLNVIVSFLAMLELVKQGIMRVSQETVYGEIQMTTKEVGVPEY